MALKYNKATTFLVVSLAMIAALLEGSTAQSTVHVVGDAMGWVVPPGGATVYSNWAASNTFKVNDVLVFNFTTGRHDVAQVTKAAFDACNTASPISRQTNSPANITLSSAGEFYYICTFTGHCLAGQKLAINVTSGASSPAPTPTPTPAAPTPTPTPTPTSSPPPTPTQTPAPTPTTSSPPSPPIPTPTSSPPPSTAATPSSTPSPDGGGATTPPPSGNSAKSLGVALSSTFLAIFVALLY
ncbi:hypothetical protein EZV62_012599 [Acer yangbiense]|uniref:Phytocyanin domain-containing protein n=1 Tax=Acer yangbiense TaxID=1000413 RepID=A0A5C7HY61_9ROSI|nr:hypothetical protein EZV62_012599 [Acer yangbiense]